MVVVVAAATSGCAWTLEWRHARSAGTHLTFSLFFPGLGVAVPINPFQGLFGGFAARMTVESEIDERLGERDPASLALPLVLRALAGGAPGNLSAEELVDLRNRRVRTSRLRVVLDRTSGHVREKSLRDDARRGQAWIRSTFLVE